MQRFFTKYRASAGILSLIALFLVVPHAAHALGVFDGFATAGDLIGRLVTTSIEVFILPLAAGFLYLAGSLMDAAINFSLNTAYIFSLSPAINLGWVIIRDLANIMFIFILIWISINTIVSGTKFGTMSMLKNVVIAALLINFSLFFTKAIVDVSNVFGNWLYGGVQNTLVVNSSDQKNPTSLSGLIATRMDIIGMWKVSGVQQNEANGSSAFSATDPSKSLIGRFLRLAVVLITTYIFIYAAGLFLARSITLLFLLVFSPIGFLGEALPSVKEYSSKWWKELGNAGIFPVAFLLMLYIALQFINSLGALNLAKVADPIVIFGASFKVADYFQYFIIIFLLNACLKVAKEYSGEVGKAIGGMAESLGKLAMSATTTFATGGTAWVGRRVIGSAASKLSDNVTINDMAAGKRGTGFASKFASQVIGKAALGAARGTAKASFDARGISGFADMAKGAGIDLGKAGGKDGFKGMVKEREESEKKYAESFGDDKAGIERRLAYAEDRKRSALTWLAVGSKGRNKIGGTIRGDAGLASVKSDTTDTQRALTEAKNKIVEEKMAQEMLTKATKMDKTGDIDTTLKRELERADMLIENSRNDEKKKLAYNRYERSTQEALLNSTNPEVSSGAREKMNQLDKEFDEATKNMLEKDRLDLMKEDNKQVKEIAELEKFVGGYKKQVKEALDDKEIAGKKAKIADIKEYIQKERIGIAKEWDKNIPAKNADGTPKKNVAGKQVMGGWKNSDTARGLAEDLRLKKKDIEIARREQAILEGKNPGKKPQDQEEETTKVDDEDEEGSTP